MQAALSTLKTEFSVYDEIVKRMQATCAEERRAREALAGKLDQLMSLLGAAANRK
jgi:hypothetical protein